MLGARRLTCGRDELARVRYAKGNRLTVLRAKYEQHAGGASVIEPTSYPCPNTFSVSGQSVIDASSLSNGRLDRSASPVTSCAAGKRHRYYQNVDILSEVLIAKATHHQYH